MSHAVAPCCELSRSVSSSGTTYLLARQGEHSVTARWTIRHDSLLLSISCRDQATPPVSSAEIVSNKGSTAAFVIDSALDAETADALMS